METVQPLSVSEHLPTLTVGNFLPVFGWNFTPSLCSVLCPIPVRLCLYTLKSEE